MKLSRFLSEAVLRCRTEGGAEDEAMILALNDRDQVPSIRRDEVLKWLQYYGIFQGLKTALSQLLQL
jgi:hypothetical protein